MLLSHRITAAGMGLAAFCFAAGVAAAKPPVPAGGTGGAGGDGPVPPQYPQDAEVPRSLTDEEREWIRRFPITVPAEHLEGEAGERGVPGAPEGPIWCPPEYAPMEGILISWKGSSGWLQLLTNMTREITAGRPGGGGYGKVFIAVASASVQSSAQTQLINGGVDMSRVVFAVRNTDSIWIRDYGPRYIYQGGVRAIVNHTYNRPRALDNAFPPFFGAFRRHNVYNLPLVHGGGNYHLDGVDRGYATSLITNENPTLQPEQVIAYWQAFQNLTTLLLPPFQTTVDSTQHLDMWMQVVADDKVMISDFISNGSVAQNEARDVCNQAAVTMAGRGYTVYRLPARNISGTHYTYTNVVMINGLVLVPQYTNMTPQQNSDALATWQQALPDWRIVGVNCDAIVTFAGVMHCIVMHVPEHLGGTSPTAFLRTQRSGETLSPGAGVFIRWGADDDVGIANNGIDLLLSHDGGQTYTTTIASNLIHSGSFFWTVPDRFIRRARVRVVARDADGNAGFDESPIDFRITGSCTADWNGDAAVNSGDITSFLGTWLESVAAPDTEADFNGDGLVNSGDITAFLSAWLDALQNGC